MMEEGQTPIEPKPTAAFVLSLIAGLWMLTARSLFYRYPGPMMMRWPWFWYHRMFHGAGDMTPYLGFWSWLGAMAGILVIIGGVIIYTRPGQSVLWGKIILIASAVGLIIGMGSFLPGILGIVAGALAIAWGRGRAEQS
jgi:hypothetical protein